MRSESQRRADAAYRQKTNAEKAVVGCQIARPLATEFKQKCAENGTTPNAILKAAIEKYITEDTPNTVK